MTGIPFHCSRCQAQIGEDRRHWLAGDDVLCGGCVIDKVAKLEDRDITATFRDRAIAERFIDRLLLPPAPPMQAHFSFEGAS